MTRDTLSTDVRSNAAEYFGVEVDDITEASRLMADLGGDDHDVIAFILELEDEYGVTLNDPEDDEAVTIAALVDDLHEALTVE